MRLKEFKRQTKQNYSEKDIRERVINNLKDTNMLGRDTTSIDPATLRSIDVFMPEVMRAKGEGTFLKNSLIKLLQVYSDKLISNEN
ncbi:MAG: hypothetical protein ACFE9L_11630 [Candidatus Hodarchaeota archaeon]